jgi:hypothetical protein
MSTLRVDTIQNAAGTDSPISVPGTAKAWVNFNGTGTVAIRASYNVSSITDNGTGTYTINLATALTDTNYVVVVGAQNNTTNTNTATNIHQGAAPTTSAFRLEHVENSAATDASQLAVAIFR